MSNKELYPKNQELILRRVEALSRILSGEEPVRIDNVTIEIEGPDYGWLDILFKMEGKFPFIIEASDVYPPFLNLRAWLEHMMDFTSFPSESFIIDCERYSVCLSYDYLGHIENENIYEPVALIQLGHDIPKEEITGDYEPLLQVIVPIRKFVSDLYNTLKKYMYDNRRVFSRHWSHPNGGDFDIRKLMRSFVSQKVEREIEQMNKFAGDLGHWPYIRIR